MAKQIATKNGFIDSDSKEISGIGNRKVDYSFFKNGSRRISFGLKKSTDNIKYDVLYDVDNKKVIHSDFIIPYTVERITQQAISIGNQLSVTENENEIIIELD